MNNHPVHFSLVIPFYNEEEMIPILEKELETHFQTWNGQHEFIFVDDGSTDQTNKLLEDWSKKSGKIKIVRFHRNQGHQKAILEGLRAAKGDCIVTMDADLQDPLHVVNGLLDKQKEGYDIVHAHRTFREGENIFRRFSAWTYYRLMKFFFRPSILLDVGDFRLITSKARDVYLKKPKQGFIRADLAELDLPQGRIEYSRHKRQAGKSKFTFKKLIELAWSGFRQERP